MLKARGLGHRARSHRHPHGGHHRHHPNLTTRNTTTHSHKKWINFRGHSNAPRYRRVPIAHNLALTRNALLAIIPFAANQALSSWFETDQRIPVKAIHLILHTIPVQ